MFWCDKGTSVDGMFWFGRRCVGTWLSWRGADGASATGAPATTAQDHSSLAFLDCPVQHLQCVLLTGSEGERPAGRFPAVHRRRGYAEQAGELGDRESALVAQLRHPAARRLEPGRRGAGPTRPPAAGPAASGGPLPGGGPRRCPPGRGRCRRCPRDRRRGRRPPPRRPATPCRRRPGLRRRRPAGGRAARDARRAGCRRRRARRPRACTSPPSREIAGEDVVPRRGVRQRHVADDQTTRSSASTSRRRKSSSGRSSRPAADAVEHGGGVLVHHRPVGTVASEGNLAGFREQAAVGIGDDAQDVIGQPPLEQLEGELASGRSPPKVGAPDPRFAAAGPCPAGQSVSPPPHGAGRELRSATTAEVAGALPGLAPATPSRPLLRRLSRTPGLPSRDTFLRGGVGRRCFTACTGPAKG